MEFKKYTNVQTFRDRDGNLKKEVTVGIRKTVVADVRNKNIEDELIDELDDFLSKDFNQCKAITNSGTRCSREATNGMYCHQHGD